MGSTQNKAALFLLVLLFAVACATSSTVTNTSTNTGPNDQNGLFDQNDSSDDPALGHEPVNQTGNDSLNDRPTDQTGTDQYIGQQQNDPSNDPGVVIHQDEMTSTLPFIFNPFDQKHRQYLRRFTVRRGRSDYGNLLLR